MVDQNAKDRERLKTCLDIALDIRKSENELIWQRTTFFWGFISLLFGLNAFLWGDKKVSLILSVIGLFFSIVWTLVNRASRSWQTSWHLKTETYFKQLYGYDRLFKKVKLVNLVGKKSDIWFHGDWSISKLLIAISDFFAIVWLTLIGYIVLPEKLIPRRLYFDGCIVFVLLYIIVILFLCRSSKGIKLKENDNV